MCEWIWEKGFMGEKKPYAEKEKEKKVVLKPLKVISTISFTVFIGLAH